MTHHIDQALRANYTMFNNKDYVVRDGEVVLVDAFSGRIQEGRRFLMVCTKLWRQKSKYKFKKIIVPWHQLLIKTCSVNIVSYLVTGTAKTEADEFREI